MIKKPPKVLNEFFSNVVTSLNIPQFNQNDRASENISDTVIKAIVYYRGHLSVIAVKENCSSKSNFNFSFVEKVDILKEIKILKSNKQCCSCGGRGGHLLPPPLSIPIKAIVYYRGHLSVIAVANLQLKAADLLKNV